MRGSQRQAASALGDGRSTHVSQQQQQPHQQSQYARSMALRECQSPRRLWPCACCACGAAVFVAEGERIGGKKVAGEEVEEGEEKGKEFMEKVMWALVVE